MSRCKTVYDLFWFERHVLRESDTRNRNCVCACAIHLVINVCIRYYIDDVDVTDAIVDSYKRRRREYFIMVRKAKRAHAQKIVCSALQDSQSCFWSMTRRIVNLNRKNMPITSDSRWSFDIFLARGFKCLA